MLDFHMRISEVLALELDIDFNMSLSDVFALESEMRDTLLVLCAAHIYVINKFNMSLNDLQALEPATRNELLNNWWRYPLASLAQTKLAIINKLSNDYWSSAGDMDKARSDHQYLVRHGIISDGQLLTSLLSESPFLEIQSLVNQYLTNSGFLLEGHRLSAENIHGLVESIQSVADIRKVARVVYQGHRNSSSAMFRALPVYQLSKIVELAAGKSRSDERYIAVQYLTRPGV